MSNDLTAFNPEYWAKEMQTIFYKNNVAIGLANTELRDQLEFGTTINKPYRSHARVTSYTKGTDITVADRTSANEYLTVDTAKITPFYVDDLDKIQNKWDAASKYAADGMKLLNNVLDQAVFAEYSNASSDVYAADIGESGATTAIALTQANIQKVFSASARKLDSLDIPADKRFAVLGPRMLETLRLYVGNKETGFGDTVSNNGLIANRFGFRLLYSNNLPFSATLTTSAAIANGETITINGCTFTFADSMGSTAGSVYSGGTDADTTTQLVAAINACTTGTEGTGNTYRLPTDKNAWKIAKAGVVATDATTTMTLVGYGDIGVSETMGQADNVWSVQVQHALFGMVGATDLLVQKAPNVEFRVAEKRLGRYIYPWMNFGKKTFADMTDALVAIHLNASGY